MLSGDLWPAHPHPYEDELFSCWLVRLIHANGIKIQTFCDRELDKNWQLWNRDIDRLAPDWLTELLSKKSGIPLESIFNTTLLSYHGILFPNTRRCGELKWILPLGIYHRTRKNYGLQYCPICLKEDNDPFFRKMWRLAFCTFCPKHNCMLYEKCLICGNAIIFYRTELGRPNTNDSISLKQCCKCNSDLSLAPKIFISKNDYIINYWKNILIEIKNSSIKKNDALNTLSISHHLCKLMTSVILSPKIFTYLSKKMDMEIINLTQGKISIERRSIAERHQVIYLSLWLMQDLEKNLLELMDKKLLRFNHLLKDYVNPPENYLRIIKKLPHRKIKNSYLAIDNEKTI